jgi:hypothetical protein
MDPDDARALANSSRVTLARQDGLALPNIYRVELDGDPIGLVMKVDGGWLAARPGWRDNHERPKRAGAVRRLLLSLPAPILETSPPTGGR